MRLNANQNYTISSGILRSQVLRFCRSYLSKIVGKQIETKWFPLLFDRHVHREGA